MKKILIVEDDFFFVSRFKKTFTNTEIYSYLSASKFISDMNKNQLLLENIHKTDLFLLDFNLGGDENIFNSGIFEIIFRNKKTDSKIISISSHSENTIKEMMQEMGVNFEFKYDQYIAKEINSLSKIILYN